MLFRSVAALQKISACQEAVSWAAKQATAKKAWESCVRPDWLFWYLKTTKQITPIQSVQIAIACAERVLSIYEKEYPDDNQPRKAIEAAQSWVKDPTAKPATYAAAVRAAAAAADAAAGCVKLVRCGGSQYVETAAWAKYNCTSRDSAHGQNSKPGYARRPKRGS